MRIAIGILVALLVIGAVAGVGVRIYDMGVARGLAESGRTPTPPSGGPPPNYGPYPYYGPFYHGPFGFGFFGLLFPVLFLFLIFALVKGLFWRPWRWHGPGGHGSTRGVPPMFEEWHRRAHESTGDARSV
jgi:hypothetical protein